MHNKMMIFWRVIIICWSSHCLVSSEPPGLPDFAESLNCWWIAFQTFLVFFFFFLSFSNVSSCLEGNRLLGQISQLKHDLEKSGVKLRKLYIYPKCVCACDKDEQRRHRRRLMVFAMSMTTIRPIVDFLKSIFSQKKVLNRFRPPIIWHLGISTAKRWHEFREITKCNVKCKTADPDI